MSLDVYLYGEAGDSQCSCPCCGHEHTRQVRTCVYDANITHNLGEMAEAAGIYGVMWRPEENGIERAEQLIKPLREGLAKLQADPDHFRQFNASNGWGLYEHFVPFVSKYLTACEQYPRATVEAYR